MNVEASIFEFGTFRFDPAQQELRQRGRRVRLSVSLIKLLTLFLSHPGELVAREQIADALWEDHGTVDVVIGINTAIRRLRAILDDDPSAPLYIETVIGLGYRFIAEVEELEAAGTPIAVVEKEFEPALTHPPDAMQSDIQSPENGLFASAKEALPGLEPRSTGRFRFLKPVGFVLATALLVFGDGILVSRHRSVPLAALQQAPLFNRAPSQITFNSEDNRITAEAVSPDGHMVAYSDRFGISLHSLDSGADRLLTSPSSFLTERISWFPDENMLVVSGVDQPSQRSMVRSVFCKVNRRVC